MLGVGRVRYNQTLAAARSRVWQGALVCAGHFLVRQHVVPNADPTDRRSRVLALVLAVEEDNVVRVEQVLLLKFGFALGTLVAIEIDGHCTV
jgi:hypothetical protein